MLGVIFTLLIGVVGGTIAMSFKIPAGAMVGAMIMVAIYSIVSGEAYVPQNLKIFIQIAAGTFIGSGITRKDVRELRVMIRPAIQMVLSMVVLDLLIGYIMYKVTGIDLLTSLFATAPAGIVDMSIISDDMGADTSKVAVLQLIRLIAVLMFFPTMMNYISKRFDSGVGSKEEDSQEVKVSNGKRKKMSTEFKTQMINFTITLSIASVIGSLGYLSGVPAGALTFSMIAAGAFNVISDRGYMPIKFRRVTQMFAGALVGSRVTYEQVVSLKGIIVPAIILLVGIIIVNLFIGFLIFKTSEIGLITSLLASAPGGLSDMALIAKDLGGDAPKVAILQLVRVVFVIAVFPILIKFIAT